LISYICIIKNIYNILIEHDYAILCYIVVQDEDGQNIKMIMLFFLRRMLFVIVEKNILAGYNCLFKNEK
jgi:hypothetical protein